VTEDGNGRVTNKELYDAINCLRNDLYEKIDSLGREYVRVPVCDEKHKYIDPRQIWGAAIAGSLVMATVTAVATAGAVSVFVH